MVIPNMKNFYHFSQFWSRQKKFLLDNNKHRHDLLSPRNKMILLIPINAVPPPDSEGKECVHVYSVHHPPTWFYFLQWNLFFVFFVVAPTARITSDLRNNFKHYVLVLYYRFLHAFFNTIMYRYPTDHCSEFSSLSITSNEVTQELRYLRRNPKHQWWSAFRFFSDFIHFFWHDCWTPNKTVTVFSVSTISWRLFGYMFDHCDKIWKFSSDVFFMRVYKFCHSKF